MTFFITLLILLLFIVGFICYQVGCIAGKAMLIKEREQEIQERLVEAVEKWAKANKAANEHVLLVVQEVEDAEAFSVEQTRLEKLADESSYVLHEAWAAWRGR
jgi:hypothetical protein